MLVNTLELRLPPPTLPYVGSSVSFVVFHDMGNVYSTVGSISFHFHQRNDQDFDYTAHAVGFGVRYRTPVGPIRVDLGYQLNPIDGLLVDGKPQTRRFRIHFSIGQAF